MTLTCLLIVLLLVAEGGQRPLPIEQEAARSIADDSQTFVARADLSERLAAALANPADDEQRGRLALLWVSAMKRTLGAIPVTADATREEPFLGFITRHDDDVVYNEPGGEWILRTATFERLMKEHARSSSAEALAWAMVENRLPGECEGYPPCYLSRLDTLHGEYLRRHPRGAHAADVVEQIRQSLEQSLRLLGEPGGDQFFNPRTDCVDLKPPADALDAVLQQTGARGREPRRLLAALRAKCQ